MRLKYLEISNECKSDVLELLSNNVIGTPGESMVYQHTTVSEKVNHIDKPHYINLRRSSSIAGTCCFCEREMKIEKTCFQTFYIRFFSFKTLFRKPSNSSKKSQQNFRGRLRQEIEVTLNSRLPISNSMNKKTVFYAYLDPENLRSAELCKEFGFVQTRQFTSLIFNRLFPKKRLLVEKLNKKDFYEMKSLLKAFYSDYSFFNFENAFYKNQYYVVRNSIGEILAGLHAHVDKWKIIEMPGLVGKLIQHVIPRLPYLKRLFNKDFDFLSIESIYYKKGEIQLIPKLIESLLKEKGLYKSMCFADVDSNLYHDLQKEDLGILNKINKNVNASVITRSIGLTPQEIATLEKKPAFISTIDLT